MSEKFPMLRFELEASKLSLLRALDDRHHEVQEMIQQSFVKALDQMQMQVDVQVRDALSKVFSEAIHYAADVAKEGLAEAIAEKMAAHVRQTILKGMK